MKRNIESNANESQELSIKQPSINSLYEAIDTQKTPAQTTPLVVAKLKAQPSFTTHRSAPHRSITRKKQQRPNYTPRFSAVPIPPTVQPVTIDVCFTGINLSTACDLFTLLDSSCVLNPMKPVIGTATGVSKIVPGFKLRMWICTEQERANGLIRPYFRQHSVVVCHFDLNCPVSSERSFRISETRMDFCTDETIRVCMIGMRNQGEIDALALEEFQRFQEKYNIEDVLILDQTQQDQEQLSKFFTLVISKPVEEIRSNINTFR